MERFPISFFSRKEEPGFDPNKTISLSDLLVMLREEEDYWEGEQHNTKLITTRLRKIYYDKWGMDSELIRGARKIECRYLTEIVGEPIHEDDGAAPKHMGVKKAYTKRRKVVYRSDDRIYGDSRAGQVPPIASNDNQVILLPDGYYYHFAHLIGAMDTSNYPQVVTPLPAWLSFLAALGPHVDSNMDLMTWLDEIAEITGDAIVQYLNNGKTDLTRDQLMELVHTHISGSDLLPDIDSFVIAANYNLGTDKGMRPTEIISHYYLDDDQEVPFRQRRGLTFATKVGLKGWDGQAFSNEKHWLRHYYRNLRDATSFQLFSMSDQKLDGTWLPLKVWLNLFRQQMHGEILLESFLYAVKNLIRQETHS